MAISVRKHSVLFTNESDEETLSIVKTTKRASPKQIETRNNFLLREIQTDLTYPVANHLSKPANTYDILAAA